MNSSRARQALVVAAALIAAVFSLYIIAAKRSNGPAGSHAWKLYWFVPDGLRADPQYFKMFEWAQQGELPNIKRMMDEGAWGYSIPVFPSHTPVNFASLFTGVSPARHGVADGPIRVRDYPLNIVPRTGFSSVAKTIDPFWFTLEQAGWLVGLLSVPGTTPPEITRGSVVKGRWGGWGIEFPSLVFHSDADRAFRERLGWNDKVFQIGKKLTEFAAAKPASGWPDNFAKGFAPPFEANLRSWDADLFVLLTDSKDDGVENYDTAQFSRDKKEVLFTLHAGEWSPWFSLDLSYRVSHNYQENMPQRSRLEQDLSSLSFPTASRVRVIKLGKPGFFRIRVLYDGLNDSLAVPHQLSGELHEAAGPMVDFVDNYPPQLIYFDEDKAAFAEEADQSFDWHTRAQKFFLERSREDVFIQSIYSPNQMLTSRWWMGALDPRSVKYSQYSADERAKLWAEVLRMYKQIDKMIGHALDARAPGSFVVLSSDHGAVPLNFEVRLNNLFASKGWLHFHEDRQAGVLHIDWAKTKVVFLNMNHVFINPAGLHGDYRPASGPEYEKLRQSVMDLLTQLKDKNGGQPLSGIHTREEAGQWGLPADRIGDLVIANQAGYNWVEDVTRDLEVFSASLKSGYKQAVLTESEQGLWTPFAIVGPGVRRGHKISRPISHLEQYPTVMKLLGVKTTYEPDRPPLAEIFESF